MSSRPSYIRKQVEHRIHLAAEREARAYNELLAEAHETLTLIRIMVSKAIMSHLRWETRNQALEPLTQSLALIAQANALLGEMQEHATAPSAQKEA